MLALATTLLSMAAVACWAGRPRGVGSALAALTVVGCVLGWGAIQGPIVALVLGMSAASAWVLIWPLRPAGARASERPVRKRAARAERRGEPSRADAAPGARRSDAARSSPEHNTARTLAALIGAPLTAAVVGAALARLLPLSREVATAWGYHSLVPVWVLLACILPLQRSGRRAWLTCAAVSLPLAAALLVAGALP